MRSCSRSYKVVGGSDDGPKFTDEALNAYARNSALHYRLLGAIAFSELTLTTPLRVLSPSRVSVHPLQRRLPLRLYAIFQIEVDQGLVGNICFLG